MIRARTRRPVLAAAMLALAAVLAACGIPLDRSPRDIPSEQDLGLSGASAPSGAGSSTGPRVYFVAADTQNGVRLQQVNREVPATVDDVLAALFKGLTDAERSDRRLTTQIPIGTTLKSAQALSDGTVVIDVDQTIFQAKTNLVVAVAQIVYTATAIPGIERVRLLVDGQAQSWTAGDGRQRDGDLTPLAYPAYYPANQPNLPPVPSPTGPTTTTLPPSTSAPPSTAAGPRATAGPPAATTTAPDAPVDEEPPPATDGETATTEQP